MLTSIKIEGYRGFRSYELRGLTTVNLLVGKNNSGKTTLLEATHLIASGGDPMVLVNAAARRGEVASVGRDEPPLLDISHFFHGHEVGHGTAFRLTAKHRAPDLLPQLRDDSSSLTATIVPVEDVAARQRTLFGEIRGTRPVFALKMQGGTADPEGGPYFVLSEEGGWLVDPRRPVHRHFGDERREGPPIVFITPDSAEPDSLGSMWNQVLRDKREREVREAMRILEPNLEDIVFQTGEAYRPYARSFAGRSGVLVSFAGDTRRVPLGSMGDGMRRLLALSISLIHARGGYLVIDEIDTGFHYSIMARMWELVVRTARESGTQVFATTHSADCVRGLGVLCKRSDDLRPAISAHKIERDLDASIPFSGDDILKAVEQDIEIR